MPPMPLCALMTGWLRGWRDPGARATVHAHDAGLAGPVAVARGRALRARLGGAGEPVGLLVVADGANALGPTAPGGYDPASVTAQEKFAAAVAGGDVDRLAALPPTILGRVAFAVLAGVVGERPAETRGLYAGAPFGVGYCVAAWRP